MHIHTCTSFVVFVRFHESALLSQDRRLEEEMKTSEHFNENDHRLHHHLKTKREDEWKRLNSNTQLKRHILDTVLNEIDQCDVSTTPTYTHTGSDTTQPPPPSSIHLFNIGIILFLP